MFKERSMFRRRGFCWALAVLTVCVGGRATAGSLCASWLPVSEEGKLDANLIDEASGMAVSRRFGKLYHVNDSGDGPFFYITERNGTKTRKVTIEGFKPKDVEEIALGPCPVSGSGVAKTCLAVADIGDNFSRRKNIEILFIEEKADFGKSVKPVARVSFQYPDKPHNSEAFAVLPNGDLVIVTKEGGRFESARAAQVYRASQKQMIEATSKKPVVFKRIGEINVPALTTDKSLGGLVTAMSLTDDGHRFVLLTYGKALEFEMDLSKDELPKTDALKSGKDFNVVPVSQLLQQESIAYDINNKDLFYSSEVILSLFNRTPPPLMKMRCK